MGVKVSLWNREGLCSTVPRNSATEEDAMEKSGVNAGIRLRMLLANEAEKLFPLDGVRASLARARVLMAENPRHEFEALCDELAAIQLPFMIESALT